MRDPQRIDRILDEVRSLWKANPDWRLSQLLVNCIQSSDQEFHAPNVFYYEDDRLERDIELTRSKFDPAFIFPPKETCACGNRRCTTPMPCRCGEKNCTSGLGGHKAERHRVNDS